MKKRFGIFGVIALLGIGCGIALAQPTKEAAQAKVENPYVLRLEEESGKVVKETKEEPIVVEGNYKEQGNDKDIVETVKSEIEQIKDTIVTVLNQPIVICGVSTTLGAIILLVIGKLIGSLNTKKIKQLINTINEYRKQMSNCASKEDYQALVTYCNNLIPVLKEIAPTIKNVPVRENVNKLLLELKPLAEETKEFAKEECEKVVNDTKEFAKGRVAKSVYDILNED